MHRFQSNQRGVALLIVLSAVLFLSLVVTQFFTEAQMSHQVALNYRHRVQGYYLAKSAINMSKMILYYSKQLESEATKRKIDLTGISYQPLYKQFPISSETLRGLIEAQKAAALAADGLDEAQGNDDSQTEDDEALQKAQDNLSLLKKEKVADFLQFSGNFSAEVIEEQSRYSLNAVSGMLPGSVSYDLHKKILLGILLRPSFANFFEYQERDARNLVHALGDYVDSNKVVNDFDNVERGAESSDYNDQGIEAKNGPFLTLSELRLVPGMTDDIYETLKPLISIYHNTTPINACLAEKDLVDALIVHYTQVAECTTPLDEQNDREDIQALRELILDHCPDTSKMATALNIELGLKSQVEADTTQTAETKQTSSKVSECKVQFEDLITGKNDIFTIEARGEVQGVETKIRLVLDTSQSRPSAWRVIFYQVE